MPRAARIKDPTAIYHAMSHSITEFELFPENSDKECFLDLLQKYKEKFHCKIYGFCLMTNHFHIIIDTCGFDISKFMKSLNQAYVKYINKKYKRRGHLLTERFNSKIIDTPDYMLTVSSYVHNNPKDLPEYNGREFEYPYSSMGFYLGKRKDKRELVDIGFVLGCVNETDKSKAIKAYSELVIERRDIGINKKLKEYLDEFMKEQYEYKSFREIILRDIEPKEVIKRIAQIFGIEDSSEIMHKWKRKTMSFRGVVAYALTVFCGMGMKETCKYMYNITGACCARLSERGFTAFRESAEIRAVLMGLRPV